MLSSGWFRVWVVATVTLVVIFLLAAGYALWGRDACYRIVTIASVEKRLSESDSSLIDSLRKEGESNVYCGNTWFSVPLMLQELAKQGKVSQVGFQWQEPRGWSFDNYNTLDTMNQKEIRVSI